MNPFDQIRKLESPNKSFQWYQDMVRKVGLASVTPAKVMRSDIGEFVTSVRPGDMYLFIYDPKTRDRLPFYDTVPLVITIDRVPGGFLGLNMHYLPYLIRMKLLNKLMEYTNDTHLSDTTKFKLKWSILKSAASFPGANVAVKRYLNTHVQSRVMRINPKDWKQAIMLPIDNFQKASRNKVHADSVSRM